MRTLRIVAMLAAFAALVTCTSSAYAGEGSRAGAITVSPLIGGYLFEGDEEFDPDGLAGGIGIGYNLTESWALEGMFTVADTELDEPAKTDVDLYLYKLDLVYNLFESHGFEPYLAAGVGGVLTNIDNMGSDNDLMVEYGGGLRYFVTDHLALRADVKHIMPFDEWRNNLSYLFGIQYQMGGYTKPAPMTEPEPAPRPAPVKTAPPPPPAPKDSDHDGVIDDNDKCPGTPEGVKVDADGCPLDTDGDGVYDYKDECPDTPKGTTVDEKGCPPPLCITLNVQFDFDEAVVKPEFHNEIKAAVDFLNKYAEGKNAVLEGHTDSMGDAEYNRRLSEARAIAVMNYMVAKFGIDANRLSAVGYGESKPIADNSTEEGRYQNRRVVLRICE